MSHAPVAVGRNIRSVVVAGFHSKHDHMEPVSAVMSRIIWFGG